MHCDTAKKRSVHHLFIRKVKICELFDTTITNFKRERQIRFFFSERRFPRYYRWIFFFFRSIRRRRSTRFSRPEGSISTVLTTIWRAPYSGGCFNGLTHIAAGFPSSVHEALMMIRGRLHYCNRHRAVFRRCGLRRILRAEV